MHRFGWMGLGALIGAVAIGGVAIVIVQIIIPWDVICATIAPTQRLVEAGGALIAELRSWLDAAEAALSAGATEEQTTQAREGLGGLIDRARDQALDVASSAANVVAAPLRALIDIAQALLAVAQEAVDAALESLASIEGRC